MRANEMLAKRNKNVANILSAVSIFQSVRLTVGSDPKRYMDSRISRLLS